MLWETSWLVPGPKTSCPTALASHIMKVTGRLLLEHLVRSSQAPLQITYRPHVGVGDAIVCLRQKARPALNSALGNTSIHC